MTTPSAILIVGRQFSGGGGENYCSIIGTFQRQRASGISEDTEPNQCSSQALPHILDI
jgi:hypothetical protein